MEKNNLELNTVQKIETKENMNYSLKIDRALRLAARLHNGQERKDDARTPYIVHPFAVMLILTKYSNDEDVFIAALLHDILEDVKLPYQEKVDLIEKEFGHRVLEIVQSVSEEKDPLQKTNEKSTWLDRKTKYIERLKSETNEALFISAADKIHNLRSMIADYQTDGSKIWGKFNSSPNQMVWFYEEVAKVVSEKIGDSEIANDLDFEVKKLKQLL